MGTHTHSLHLLLRLSSTPTPSLNPNTLSYSNRLFAAGSPRWSSKSAARSTSAGRSRFDFEVDEDEDWARKRRTWWSADVADGGGGFLDLDDDEEEDGFWVLKVVQAFGWILPAVAISLLLGTGPNAFLMALAVPLGQTALSLVVDKVWGSTMSSPKPRRRTKVRKRPVTAKRNERKGEETKGGSRRGSYQSWVGTDHDSFTKGSKEKTRFGGWDELDKMNGKVPKGTPVRDEDGLQRKQKFQNRNKLSSVRDTPLLLRLLIAAFPFLASWTRFLF
ncbi:hypothetical protein K2173_003814 [Erythroxylum novogranatense]|uniref:Uncharacterized protein n=1 Tax=Erythroxylum novogranatense TaxID=1862640 RepID=A0AAV8SJP7_9ROSI|nr:hypothetical protein K2173_003814 [Erythroxylum novogranatense]